MRILALALNTFREAIRNKILYSLLFFAVMLIISALALGQITLHDEARVTRDVGLGGIALFGVLIAIFVGVNLVYKEIDRKTVFTLIPKPIHRFEFILGKFAGMILTLAIQVAIMTAVLFAILFVQERSLEAEVLPILRAVVLLFLEVSVITAVAVFFSTFTSPFLSGVFTLGIFIVGRSTPELVEVIGKSHNPALKAGLLAALKIVPNLHIFYVSGSMLGGRTVSVHAAFIDWSYVGDAALYAGGWAGVVLICAMLLFQRRDFV